jgi:hypothetical protein
MHEYRLTAWETNSLGTTGEPTLKESNAPAPLKVAHDLAVHLLLGP